MIANMTSEERRLWQHTYAAAFVDENRHCQIAREAATQEVAAYLHGVTAGFAVRVANSAVIGLREFERKNPEFDLPLVTGDR